MIKLILVLSLFVMGCSRTIPSVFIDKEFIPYVEMYKVDKKLYTGISKIKRINIKFNQTPKGFIGVCRIFGILTRTIEVNPDYWNNVSDNARQELIYHELGHCDLDIFRHVDSDSLMNAYTTRGRLFDLDKKFFIELLFKEHR